MHAFPTGQLQSGDSESTTTADLSQGERWVREALDRLRARRFSPPGLVEFLAASFARARRVRGHRPELVSQSRRFGAIGLAGSAALGPRAVLRWLGWWAMLDWHLGMVESDGGPEPRARALGAADAVTLSRLWAAPLARRTAHPAVIALASATDVVDGLLARRVGPTRLGRDLDWAADASFFHAAVDGLVERGSLRPWILAAERAHLLIVVGAGAARYLGASTRPATPDQRAIPATLGATGLLLAATVDRCDRGGRRADRGAGRRASHALVAGAIAARTLRGLQARGRANGPSVG
ncbi:hypothetical protein BH24ACT24_BH24ACT24_10330 [soil metagenome]|jgi:phosphatidylglycerophosphate synthase